MSEEPSGTSRGEIAQRNQQRRSVQQRPHSLAVQPLNYQRLDPELQLLELQLHHRNNQGGASGAAAGGARRPATASSSSGGTQQKQQKHQPSHPNMTSQESIGSCSLDVERSASDRSGARLLPPTHFPSSTRTLYKIHLLLSFIIPIMF